MLASTAYFSGSVPLALMTVPFLLDVLTGLYILIRVFTSPISEKDNGLIENDNETVPASQTKEYNDRVPSILKETKLKKKVFT